MLRSDWLSYSAGLYVIARAIIMAFGYSPLVAKSAAFENQKMAAESRFAS